MKGYGSKKKIMKKKSKKDPSEDQDLSQEGQSQEGWEDNTQIISSDQSKSSSSNQNPKSKSKKIKLGTVAPQPAPKPKVERKPSPYTVDGNPYAPISLEKCLKTDAFKIPEDVEKDDKLLVRVLINNSGNGFQADDPNTINVMIEDRVMQAKYFIEEVYPKLERVPAYLYRYIHWMMEIEPGHKYDEFKYPTDNDYIQALNSGVLTKDDDEYQQIDAFIRYGVNNSEAIHLIGILQLVGGTIKQFARDTGGCPRFYIEYPETGFHPKRERMIMTLIHKLAEDYGPKKDWTPTK